MKNLKIKAVLFKSKTLKDGTHPVMIRVTQDRKVIYKATGISVPDNAWDEENLCVYTKAPKITKRQAGQVNSAKLSELKIRYQNAIILHNAEYINSVIEDALQDISTISQKVKLLENEHNISSVKKAFVNNGDPSKQSFMAFAVKYQDNFLNNNSIGTYKSYKSILKKLTEYKKSKDILFSDITFQFLTDYQKHLVKLGNGTNTIHNNLKSIKAIYKEAIIQGIISGEKNPFDVYKLKTDNKTKKEKLSIAEIQTLEDMQLENGSLISNVRNIFLFSFYCAGIRISDALRLKWSNVTRDGRLDYQMEKTGMHKSISLIPKAISILDSYKHNIKNNHYIFPFLDSNIDYDNDTALFNHVSNSTALINKYLKIIGEKGGIDKKISTHIARHSFSDIARKQNANVYDISKMLGHSSIKITEAYLASFDIESQDRTMNKIFDY